MAKKSLGYVNLEWSCPNCRGRNPGPAEFCMACGSPQPEGVEFEQAPSEQFISDEEQIARAKSGPDIHCPYCRTRNPATAKFCARCGGELAGGTRRESGRVVGAHRTGKAAPVNCPACNAHNPGEALECQQCGASLRAEASHEEREIHERGAKSPKKSQMGIVLGAVLAAVVCIVLGFVLAGSLRTEDLVGQVSQVSWERSIGIEALGPVKHRDWLEDLPAEAQIGACEERLHHTESEYVPDSVEVCGTPYTVDTGTGMGEVVQDCEYQVYRDFCEYTVQEWTEVDRVTASGSSTITEWPQITLADGQREGTRRQAFEVSFDSDKGVYTYELDDDSQFALFQPGSRWLLSVNAFRAVVEVAPAR